MSEYSSDRERQLIIWAAAEARRRRGRTAQAGAVTATDIGVGDHRVLPVALDVGAAVDWQLALDDVIPASQ